MYTAVNLAWMFFSLCKDIIFIDPQVFDLRERLEVKRSMLFAVERKWRIDLNMYGLLLDATERATHEAIVPRVILRYQEVSPDLVTQ